MSDRTAPAQAGFSGELSRPEIVARLLLLDEPWMMRRKLVVTVLDEWWHRKQLSIDIRIPPNLTRWACDQSHSTVPVPITMLNKAPEATMDFDLRDAKGHALSLPLLVENLDTSGAVLEAAAALVSDTRGLTRDASVPLARILHAVRNKYPKRDKLRASNVFIPSRLYSLPTELLNDPRFSWLALRLIDESLIVVDLPADCSSHIVKLSFLARNDRSPIDFRTRFFGKGKKEPFTSWSPYTLELVADDWPCGSFHLEAQAPEDLEIVAARISRSDWNHAEASGQPVGSADGWVAALPGRSASNSNRIKRTHLYLGEDDDPGLADVIGAEIAFRMQRRGFLSVAVWLSLLLLVFLLATAVLLTSMAEHLEASTVLLAGAATIAATAMMQTAQHSLAARLLSAVRYAVLLSASVMFGDVIWLFALDSIPHEPLEWNGVVVGYDVAKWSVPVVAAAVGLGCTAICLVARFLPTSRSLASKLDARKPPIPLDKGEPPAT